MISVVSFLKNSVIEQEKTQFSVCVCVLFSVKIVTFRIMDRVDETRLTDLTHRGLCSLEN